jgi:hypothetical protein
VLSLDVDYHLIWTISFGAVELIAVIDTVGSSIANTLLLNALTCAVEFILSAVVSCGSFIENQFGYFWSRQFFNCQM